MNFKSTPPSYIADLTLTHFILQCPYAVDLVLSASNASGEEANVTAFTTDASLSVCFVLTFVMLCDSSMAGWIEHLLLKR